MLFRSFGEVAARKLAGTWPSRYFAEVLTDDPAYCLRLGETFGPVAFDIMDAYHGTYSGGVTYSQPGAIAGDANKAVGVDGTGYVAITPTLPDDYAVEVSF